MHLFWYQYNTNLWCEWLEFPCKYLGLPLSFLKLTKEHVCPFIYQICGRLPGWKAGLLTKAGRWILVQFVLTSMLIYLAMAIDLQPWAINEIDRIRRGFFLERKKGCKGRTPPGGMAYGVSPVWAWLSWHLGSSKTQLDPPNEMALVEKKLSQIIHGQNSPFMCINV